MAEGRFHRGAAIKRAGFYGWGFMASTASTTASDSIDSQPFSASYPAPTISVSAIACRLTGPTGQLGPPGHKIPAVLWPKGVFTGGRT